MRACQELRGKIFKKTEKRRIKCLKKQLLKRQAFAIIYRHARRGVAQFGSALGSGPRGRGFESRRLDQKSGFLGQKRLENPLSFFFDVQSHVFSSRRLRQRQKGIEVSIKQACYRETDREIFKLRGKAEKTGSIVTDYKDLSLTPLTALNMNGQTIVSTATLIEVLHLSEQKSEILNGCMNRMMQSQVCAELGIGRGTIDRRTAGIRRR